MNRILISVCALCLMAGMVRSQDPSRKIALVIGVKSYQNVPPLKNTINDAKSMAAILKERGFVVTELYDPQTKRDMQDAIRKHLSLIQGQTNTAGLIYYSGHGMQVDGINYLIPTSANPQIKADLDEECLKMDYVMAAIEEAGNPLNIFILDACRNNPFRSFSRAAQPGLSQVSAPKGSYIVYATAANSVASDGTGENGLFTSKLLKYISAPGLNIEEVFKSVARDVSNESGGTQIPWLSQSYFGDFYFNGTDSSTKGGMHVEAGDNRTTAADDLDMLFAGAVAQYRQKEYEAAGKTFHSLADKGDARAQFYLGKMYFSGHGYSRNYNEAFKWYSASAAGNNSNGQLSLGRMYAYGLGIGQNYEEAMKWVRKSAEQGNPKAMDFLGECYGSGLAVQKNEEQSVQWYNQAAQAFNNDEWRTDPDDQYWLALLYLSGNGYAKDLSKALTWLRKSAEGGNQNAQYTLGNMYYNGEGVPPAYDDALGWYTEAANQGNAGSQYMLGFMNYYGKGVQTDYRKAAYWFKAAAEQGHTESQYFIGYLYWEGKGVDKDCATALKFFRQASENKNAMAMYSIGWMNANGNCVVQNYKEAMTWYMKSAEQGNTDAMNNIGVLYRSGFGVPRDNKEAANWYRQAADLGNPLAQNNLAAMYENGWGVRKSKEEALKWYQKAADNGNESAKAALKRLGH